MWDFVLIYSFCSYLYFYDHLEKNFGVLLCWTELLSEIWSALNWRLCKSKLNKNMIADIWKVQKYNRMVYGVLVIFMLLKLNIKVNFS